MAYTVDQESYVPTSVSYSNANNNGALTKSSTTTYYSSTSSGYPYSGAVPIGAAPVAQPILQPQQVIVNPQPIPQAGPIGCGGGACGGGGGVIYGGGGVVPQPIAQPIPQPIPQAIPIAQPIPQAYAQPLITQQPIPLAQPIPVGGGGGGVIYGGGGGIVGGGCGGGVACGGGGVVPQPIPQPIPQVYAQPIPQVYAQPIPQPYGGGGVVYGGGGVVYGGGGGVYGGGGGVIAQPIPQSVPIIYSGGCDIYGGVGCGGGGGGGVIYGGGIVGGGGGVIYGGGGGVIYGGGVVGGGCGGGIACGGAVPIQPFSVDTVAPVSLVTYPQTAVVVSQPIVAAPTPCATGKCSSSVDTYLPNVVVPASTGTVTAGTTVVSVPLKSSNVIVGSGSTTASSCLLTIRGLSTLALSPTSSVCSSVVNCLITYISNYVQYAINALNYNSSTTLTVNSQDENVDLWKALENVAGSINEDGYGPSTTTASATATSSACTNDLSPVFARTSKGGTVFVNSCWARMAKAYPPFVPVTLKPGSVSSGGKFAWPDDVQNPNYVVANYYVLSAFRLTNFTLYYFRPCMSTSTYTVLSSALQSLNDISALITANNISSANSLLSDLQSSLSQLTSA